MSSWHERSRLIAGLYARFGALAVVQSLLFSAVNKLLLFKQFDLSILTHGQLHPNAFNANPGFHTRDASLADLFSMAKDGRWQINSTKIDNFRAGDRCLLTCMGETPVGYSWSTTRDHTAISPYLTISLPKGYLYSYAGLTLDECRGLRLHGQRHRALLVEAQAKGRSGLFSYAEHVNFASRAAQRRSGFRRVGSIWQIGSQRHFVLLRSRWAREWGVRRL
ncbi:MAG: hypothetical protein ABL964_01365 [Steroidobacteraceae bacterium]